MDAYIDKENLISIFKNSRVSEIVADGIKLLKKHGNITYNFSENDIKSEEILAAILRLFTQGVGEQTSQIFTDEPVPHRPVKPTIHRELNKQSVLLLNEDLSAVKQIGGIIAGEVGEEERIFKMLFLNNNEYRFERHLKIGADFCSWGDACEFSMPFTDIILLDQYLFSSYKDAQHNLFELITSLCRGKNLKINILLITKKGEIDKSKEMVDFTNIVRNAVKHATDIAPKITTLEVRDIRGINSLAEHDRTILTNYGRIYSGDTFSNYFNPDNSKKTKGREIHFSSLAHTENQNLADTLILDIQNTLDWFAANNPDAIQGDKKSNFLTFRN